MIKKVITITLLLFCLKLLPLFSCGVYLGTAPALHPVVLSKEIMLIEERAEIAYDAEENRFFVKLDLVYENSGEGREAKARFRTGRAKHYDGDVHLRDYLNFRVKINGNENGFEQLYELSPHDRHYEDLFYIYSEYYKRGRNSIKLSYELLGDNFSYIETAGRNFYRYFYFEDIYKKTLATFSISFVAKRGKFIIFPLPYRVKRSAVTFNSISYHNTDERTFKAGYLLLNSGEGVTLDDVEFRHNYNSLKLNVAAYDESFFENIAIDLMTASKIIEHIFDKDEVNDVGRQYIEASRLIRHDYRSCLIEDVAELNSSSDNFIDFVYYHYLAGFMYPFPNRAKVREAFNKVPFYFPDEKFTFDSLSEQAQERFYQLNSYRNSRLQPESYQPFVKNLRLRSESGLNGEVVGKLLPFQPVRLLERGESEVIDGVSGNWVLVEDSRGLKGWCFDGYMEGLQGDLL